MASSEEFCLRWKDFETNLSQSFAGIRDKSQFFDCTLATDDGADLGYLRAHKVILSACSEFFRDILAKEIVSVHPNPLIYLGGVSAKNMKSVLDFMYHGEVNVAEEELTKFLKVAETLKIKGLMDGSNLSSAIKRPHPPSVKKRPAAFLSSNDSHKRPKIKPSPLYTNLEAEETEEEKVKSEGAFSISDGTVVFEQSIHNDNEHAGEDKNPMENFEDVHGDVDNPSSSCNEEDKSDHGRDAGSKGKENDREDVDDSSSSSKGCDESGAVNNKGSESGPPTKIPGTKPSNKFYKLKYTERREKIANRLKEGKRTAEIMKELECSEQLVYKVKKLLKDKESLAAWYC